MTAIIVNASKIELHSEEQLSQIVDHLQELYYCETWLTRYLDTSLYVLTNATSCFCMLVDNQGRSSLRSDNPSGKSTKQVIFRSSNGQLIEHPESSVIDKKHLKTILTRYFNDGQPDTVIGWAEESE